jgi:IclR family transcriptional regulator, positive regulator for flagellar biogenesis
MTERLRTREAETALLTVERGMHVLRSFRCERASLTNAELVRRTGLSKATVSRLTSTMLQVGVLRHAPGGREFQLATGPLAIGHSFLASSALMRAADPHLKQLADRLGVSVALAVGDRLQMLYVGYQAGREVGTLRMGVGSVLSMGSTSIGHAYLWGLPAPDQERLLPELRREAAGDAAAVEAAIRHSFAELESTGTCGVLGGHRRGTYGVSLPVRLGRQRIVMGLSCGKADVRPDLAAERRRIAPALHKAARELEQALAEVDGQP